jgi:tetratricopeptide (TPR) repeat protein
VTFATAWYFLALAPETTLSPLSEVVNDHRPYFAAALGLAPLTAWALWAVAQRIGRARVAVSAVTLCACIAAVPVVRKRNWIWQDGLRLWLDAEEKGPTNGRAALNAGREWMKRGHLAEARASFDRSLSLMPLNPYLFMNISVLEAAERRPAEALTAAKRALELAPNNPIARQYYEQALAGAGEAGLMERGLDALYRRADPGAAVEAFAAVLARNPEHYGATYQSAVALERLGRIGEARKTWVKVLRLAASYDDAPTARTANEHLSRLSKSDDSSARR